MLESPLRCSCGVTAFTDIRFPGDGVMSLTCFQCRQTIAISMSAVMAEQAWEAAERESPEPDEPVFIDSNGMAWRVAITGFLAAESPERVEQEPRPAGYKYPAML